MLHSQRHRSLVTGYAVPKVRTRSLVTAICILASLHPCIPASEDEAALRALVEKFFAAYAKKDLDGFMALWSEKSPDYAARKQTMQQRFAAWDDAFANLTLSRMKVEGEKASLRVAVASTAINVQTKQSRKQPWVRDFAFVKEGSVWKVWRETSAFDDLANALVAAKTEEERTALLAQEKELMTAELVSVISAKGDRYYQQRNYPQALAVYRLAQGIAEQIGHKAGIAAALGNIGVVYNSQGKHAQAIEFYQKAQTMFEALRDKTRSAAVLFNIGICHYQQGRYSQALEFYKKSLTLYEELEDKAGMANTLSNMGIIHNSQSNYVQARECYQKSLTLYEELGNKARAAVVLLNLGVVHSDQGNYAQAIECYQKSRTMKEVIGDKAGMAIALINIGVVHKEQGNNDLALEFYQKGLKLAEEVDHKAWIANALTHIGNVHVAQGNYGLGLEFYQKNLTLNEASRNKVEIAKTLNNMGVVHLLQGNYDLALEYFQKSLALSETMEDKHAIATTLGNIGSVYKMQRNYDLALEFLQKSLAIHETQGNKVGIAQALGSIGNIREAQRDYAQALECYQKSLAISQMLEDRAGIAMTLGNMAVIHKLQGNYALALEFADRAAVIARQIGERETLWRARNNAGDAHRALNQPIEARQAFVEAVAIIESLRTHVAGGEQAQQRSFENKVRPYHAMVELLIAENKVSDALTYAERAKARVLLDVLQSGRGYAASLITKAMTETERERERALNNTLVSLNTQISREKMRKQPDEVRLADLNKQLEKTRLDYEAFQTSLYAVHPELKAQRGEAKPLTLDEAHSLLPDAKTALLQFVVTEEKTYLFALTHAKGPGFRGQGSKVSQPSTLNPQPLTLKVYPLDIKRSDLAKRIEEFRKEVSDPNRGLKSARSLYDQLLEPAKAQLQGKTTLVIVPDGPLWDLPFQALQVKENRYLLEDCALVYAPSLTVLREMTKLRVKGLGLRVKGTTTGQPSTLNPQPSTLGALLAFGNPSFGKQTVERVQLVKRDADLKPLPEAEREVKTLAQLYAGRSKVYIGADACEDRVKAEAGQYQVLHFATHGILNNASPMYSHLLLAQSESQRANESMSQRNSGSLTHLPIDPLTQVEDGLLEAWELMKLDLKADLTVLSACQTARGRVANGEGVIGLTWALFVAGCPTTVVSQWEVDSASTSQLMVEFHKRLKLAVNSEQSAVSRRARNPFPLTKAESLRQAALKLLRSSEYRHPFYWAGFVVVGDGR